MKTQVSSGFLLLVAVLLSVPVAHAQVSDNCEVYYCTAYAAYSGTTNVLSGYVEYYDETEEVDLGIDLYVGGAYQGEATGLDDVEYDLTSFNPTSDGTWDMTGYVWYNDGEDEDDGSITYSVLVVRIPTGESNTATGGAESGYTGSKFDVSLNPSTWDFDGYNETEAFNSSATDTCYNMFRDAMPQGNPSPAMPYTVSSNKYGDQVAAPNDWVSHYQGDLSSGQSCGWSTAQSISYYSTQYITNTIGVSLTKTTACASRAGTNGSGC